MKPTSSGASRDNDDHLNYYIHDGASHLRFDIEGSLSGQAARELEQSRCTASSVIGNRSLVIALGDVSTIDPIGCALLRSWHEARAHVVKSRQTAALVSSIIGRPVECGPEDGASTIRTN